MGRPRRRPGRALAARLDAATAQRRAGELTRHCRVAALVLRLDAVLAGESLDVTALVAWLGVMLHDPTGYALGESMRDEWAARGEAAPDGGEAWRLLGEIALLDAAYGMPPVRAWEGSA